MCIAKHCSFPNGGVNYSTLIASSDEKYKLNNLLFVKSSVFSVKYLEFFSGCNPMTKPVSLCRD